MNRYQHRLSITALLCAGLLLGCMTIKPLTGKARPMGGPYPEDYREIVHHWIDENFSDLQGINSLEIVPPVPGVAESFFGSRRVFGWRSAITLRAYDRIGMPTGPRRYNLLIREGRVAEYVRKIQ